ncbi:hypothetical protein H1R20_g10556, partial [Candolleomyces eurysporus]
MADFLDYFAWNSSQLQETLIGHRFELFLRILNSALSYTPLDEIPARTIAPLPNGIAEEQVESLTLAFFSKDDRHEHVKDISKECRIQLCETVLMYMNNVRVQRVSFLLTEGTVVLKLLVPTLSDVSPWCMDSTVLPYVSALNRRVAEYVYQKSSTVTPAPVKGPERIAEAISQNSSTATPEVVKDPQERIAKAIVYVTRIFDAMSLEYKATHPDTLSNDLNGIAEYDNVHRVYTTSFNSLVDTIHQALVEVEFPDELLGFSERKRWKQLSRHRNICEGALSPLPEEPRASPETRDEMSRKGTGEITISIPSDSG